jgi:hypothetical protein
MPKRNQSETETKVRTERKPSESRQFLLEAADGKSTVLEFETTKEAKSAAYLWWGNRRRAGLSDKVAVSLDTKAMTVTIGPRQATSSTAADAGDAPEPAATAEDDGAHGVDPNADDNATPVELEAQTTE